MIPAIFPPQESSGWSEKEDQSLYGVQLKTNDVEIETEDGYSWIRPRSTRKPPKIYKTGFTLVNQDHYNILMEMWEQYGRHRVFSWTNPVTEKTLNVKFSKPPEFNYSGLGKNRLYNIKVELKTT